MGDAEPTGHERLRTSRFELAPPRRFVLPAVLLLLCEKPGYGYSLEKELRAFNCGKIDRPTVYRALAHLEEDGLVHSWPEMAADGGHERRVYAVTPLGERTLGTWMSVVKEERDLLARVLRRYQATGSTDALLAEVDGGWSGALGSGWSPVSPTTGTQRNLRPVAAERPVSEAATDTAGTDPARAGQRRFPLAPDRSVVLIEVRSTVGPISFGAIGLDGHVDAALAGDTIATDPAPSAHVDIAVDGLRSGNSLYDAELARRIDAHRFPSATLDLTECAPSGTDRHYRLTGDLTFHGVTRPLQGTVNVEATSAGRLVITGEQVIDIRDFGITSPTVLMLRIYPDARVRLHVEVDLEEER
jgi:DNA-binding PadR family transcriptional regulator